MVPFGNDPLWKVNPHGVMALYHDRLNMDFWKYKHEAFDIVCAVDGAWGRSSLNKYGGGIGGSIKNKIRGIIYTFSGPVIAKCSYEAELLAILLAVQVLKKKEFAKLSIIICSDSSDAINFFRDRGDWDVKHRLKLLSGEFLDFDLKELVSKLCFVQREINQNADDLEKKGLDRVSLSCFWDATFFSS